MLSRMENPILNTDMLPRINVDAPASAQPQQNAAVQKQPVQQAGQGADSKPAGHAPVYLDYAAATPLAPEVLEAMAPYWNELFQNPSAPYASARKVRTKVDEAKATIAHLIGARPANITMTAGATEANNLAFAATDGHVVVSAIEHESVLACAKAREHTVVSVTGNGRIDPQEVAKAIRPDTTLVSIALANGEIGTIQPMRAIAQAVGRERQRRLEEGDHTPIWLHSDASQAVGSVTVNISSLGVDMLTVSAAKIYGPKQVGMLWAADGVALRPVLLGGGQENGLRSGTENVAGIIGFARALEIACTDGLKNVGRPAAMRSTMQNALTSVFPWAKVFGPTKDSQRLPGLLAISFPGLEARRLVILLEQKGISVGTGSACAASKMRNSHVLEALGADQAAMDGSLRITFGRPTTEEDVGYATAQLVDAVIAECNRLGINATIGDIHG